MGLRERLLTAGVALPLVLWFILYDARLCLALALALQAVCIQELGGLLRKTSAARAVASVGVDPLRPLVLHAIALLVGLASAFGGRDTIEIVMSTGMALLVVCRLALMRDHWSNLDLQEGADPKGGDSTKSEGHPSSSPSSYLGGDPKFSGSSVAAAVAAASKNDRSAIASVSAADTDSRSDGGKGARVTESGVFLLALEVSAMAWLVGGWSSLVALRFRGSTGAADMVVLLAIIFNSDNGGLLAGSVFKMLRPKEKAKRSPQQQQQHQQHLRPIAKAKLAARTTTTTNTTIANNKSTPGMLAVASPNKTWVGVAGAVFLGTSTALALGVSDRLLLLSPYLYFFSGEDGGGELSRSNEVFAFGHATQMKLGAAGVALCAVGIVGDLWESLLKRAANVKDSGYFFPGHGGCLDRLDGVLAAAPLYLTVVRMWEAAADDDP